MKYRYILNHICSIKDELNTFRLIGGSNLRNFSDCIRVDIPTDIELEKYSCDPYSTTESTKKIGELNPKVMVRLNGKLVLSPKLTQKFESGIIDASAISEEMSRMGFMLWGRAFGYLTKTQYKFALHFIRKIWQLSKIPNGITEVDDFDSYKHYFVADSKYSEVYGSYIIPFREYINKTPELKFMRSYSDVELMDAYAKVCFSQSVPRLYDLSEVDEKRLKYHFMEDKPFSYYRFLLKD